MSPLRQSRMWIEARRLDPLAWLVRSLSERRRVLPLALVRVAAAIALAVYFARLLDQRTLLASALEQWRWLGSAWLIAIASCLSLALGIAPRACAALVLAAAIATARCLRPVAYLDDLVAVWLAAWLALLPLHELPGLRGVPGARGALANALGAEVGWGTAKLLLLGSSVLYAQPALWRANAPGYDAQLPLHALLALAPLLALGRRTAGIGLLLLLGGHAWLVQQAAPTWSNLALLGLAPLYLEPVLGRLSPHPTPATAPPTRMTAMTCIALIYVLVAALQLAPASATRTASARLMQDALSFAPRAARAQALPTASVELIDEGGRPAAQAAIAADSTRAILLRSYLTDSPWLIEGRRSETLGDRLRQTTADAVCVREPAGRRLALRSRPTAAGAAPDLLLRFECVAKSGRARLLPRAADADELPLPSEPGFTAPSVIPAQLHPEAYVGSAECAPCHAAQAERMQRSEHAHAWIEARADTVRGDFAREPPPGGAAVQMLRDAHGDAALVLADGDGGARGYRVDRALGEGRRFQAYLSEQPDGTVLLPWLWLSQARRWLPVADLYPEIYDRSSPMALQVLPLAAAGCAQCHGTAAHLRAGSEGPKLGFSEPAVGCEGCHGPGRTHVLARRGETADGDPYAGGIARAADRCAQCHGPRTERSRLELERGPIAGALEHSRIAADGRSELPESEAPAFGLSACHLRGGATCSTCHSAHAQAPLDPKAPERCTGCHTALADPLAQRAHTPHPSGVGCQGCHMPQHAFRGEPALGLRITHHAIAVPRPAEAMLLGKASACTGCHPQHDNVWASAMLRAWKMNDSVRPFVRELHAIKSAAFPAAYAVDVENVRAALASDSQPLRAGLLRLLARVRHEPRLLALLQPFAADRDPALRAAALHALAVHDPEPMNHWLEIGSHDADPLVRTTSLRRQLDLQRMDEHAQRRYLRDVLEYATDPVPELLRLADLRTLEGQRSEALSLLDLAARYALPGVRAGFELQRQNLRRRFAPAR